MPASATSVTVTATASMARPAGYLGSVLVAACVTVDRPALTPRTVIVFVVFQSPGPNTTGPLAVAFAGAPLAGVTVTLAVGLESSTTV